MHQPDKNCVVCGRVITWRKKWARDWENVKYCSQACRQRKLQPIDEALEHLILDLLRSRSHGASICPSEAARALGARQSTDWRSLMEPTRMAARRLVHKNQIQITQRGQVVDPSTAKGPIRLKLSG